MSKQVVLDLTQFAAKRCGTILQDTGNDIYEITHEPLLAIFPLIRVGGLCVYEAQRQCKHFKVNDIVWEAVKEQAALNWKGKSNG